MKRFSCVTESERETRRLAARLARRLKKNDCLALTGDFGSGKTTFVKGLAEGLKVRRGERVSSPSFVILKIYRGKLAIYHFDLYRLDRPRDFDQVGLTEFAASGGVTAIEWADKVKDLLPEETLTVRFSGMGPRKRRIRFMTRSERLARVAESVVKRSSRS